MLRYDLVPQTFNDRVAYRFTGDTNENGEPTGGALKYGESNWELGLPTSDVINHILSHIYNYQEKFRRALMVGGFEGLEGAELMNHVQKCMRIASENDDDLAGAAWGIAVLMRQEQAEMFHDDKYKVQKNGRKDRRSEKSNPRSR